MKITFRIWILIIVLGFSILAIKPSFDSGVIVDSINKDSTIFEEGLRDGEIIKFVNGIEIKDVSSYGERISELFADGEEKRLDIRTKEREYTILTNSSPEITVKNLPKTSKKPSK